ncbi:MAG: pyridoxamine 5'-phosphate oxidase [Luteibaculum sp.]
MSVKDKLREVRTNYTKDELLEAELPALPFPLFESWLSEALKKEKEPNAMMLATIGAQGYPQSRVVLLRAFTEKGFVFYTNYQSNKAKELAKNAKVSATFFWPSLERQVRIEGAASKVPEKQSDDYFATRPRESQLGAWASAQSQKLESREQLEKKLEQIRLQYEGKEVPRPPHWGGFLINPNRIEFWQGRASRLHDRIVYTEIDNGKWSISRLNP